MSDPTSPGWHRDPSGQERWWNGVSWSEQLRRGTPSVLPASPPGPGPRPWLGGVLLLVGGLLLVCVASLVSLLVWLGVSITGGPRDVSEDFFGDLREGRLESAAARLCDRYAGEGADRIGSAYGQPVYGFEVVSVERRDDTAVVIGRITTGSASAYPVRVSLVRESGEWKVCSLPPPS